MTQEKKIVMVCNVKRKETKFLLSWVNLLTKYLQRNVKGSESTLFAKWSQSMSRERNVWFRLVENYKIRLNLRHRKSQRIYNLMALKSS